MDKCIQPSGFHHSPWISGPFPPKYTAWVSFGEKSLSQYESWCWFWKASGFCSRFQVTVLILEATLVPRIVLFSCCCFFLCGCAIFYYWQHKNLQWINAFDGAEGSCWAHLWRRQSSEASAQQKPAKLDFLCCTVFFGPPACKVLQILSFF